MVREWNINMKHNHYTSSVWSITPQKGKLLLFPSWLEHEVSPGLSQESRISISFNSRRKTLIMAEEMTELQLMFQEN